MSLESGKSMGRIATLLILILTVATPFISVIAAFAGLFSNVLFFAIVSSLVGSVGPILFLVAMHRLASHYGESVIFRHSLYAFITSIVGAVVLCLLLFGFLYASIRPLVTSFPIASDAVSTFAVSFIVLIAIVWLGTFVIALIQGVFYRNAFYALAGKSGESHFRQAGLFMFIGGILSIVFVGALLFFIGWIFAFLGFSAMKGTPSPAYASPSQPSVSQAAPQKKRCAACGAENADSAIYCSQCGSKL